MLNECGSRLQHSIVHIAVFSLCASVSIINVDCVELGVNCIFFFFFFLFSFNLLLAWVAQNHHWQRILFHSLPVLASYLNFTCFFIWSLLVNNQLEIFLFPLISYYWVSSLLLSTSYMHCNFSKKDLLYYWHFYLGYPSECQIQMFYQLSFFALVANSVWCSFLSPDVKIFSVTYSPMIFFLHMEV